MHVIWLHQKEDFQVHKYGGGGKKLSTVAVQIFTYQFITLDVQFFLYSRVGSCVVLSQIIGSFIAHRCFFVSKHVKTYYFAIKIKDNVKQASYNKTN